MSEMGDAVAMLPPRHATLRICVEANQRSIDAIERAASPSKPGAAAPSSAHAFSIVERLAHAPRRSSVGERSTSCSSATALVARKTRHGWLL